MDTGTTSGQSQEKVRFTTVVDVCGLWVQLLRREEEMEAVNSQPRSVYDAVYPRPSVTIQNTVNQDAKTAVSKRATIVTPPLPM